MSYEGPAAGTTKSVDLSMPAEFSVSGNPVTTTGTLTTAWVPVANNLVLAGPSAAGPSAPNFRALLAADIPNLDAAKITSGTFGTARIPNLDASIITTGTMATARLGSGADSTKLLGGDQVYRVGPIVLACFTTAVHNPADTTPYYFGQPGLAATTTADTRRVYIPYAGTIIAAWFTWNAVSAAGTNESIAAALRINNTTDYSIASVANTNAYKNFINKSLSIAVSALDYFEIKITPPAWATNPTSVIYQGGVLLSAT